MRDQIPCGCSRVCATLVLLAVSLQAETKAGDWTAAGTMRQARAGAAAAVLRDGRVLVTRATFSILRTPFSREVADVL